LLQLLNTMTGRKEDFHPLEPGKAKVFTCGPSIYRRPHIGNYRTFLYEDLLVRFLEFQGLKVRRIINMTDVEDKSIEEAHSRGEKMQDITSDAAGYFLRETAQLEIKLPEVIPSSSSTIQEAAEITRILMEKGHAYEHGGNIFFDPLSIPRFGKLYGLDMKKWPKKRVRFKRDTYNGNRWNRGDFILWHGDNGEHIHFWDSPIGRGRPSWNIQDPAIIYSHLGEQVDINCGGIDNIFRHHDYNIAIMEALTGKEYAQVYLHGEHLTVDGTTMSKSRGNILYPENIYGKGFTPGELRFFLTCLRHYRKKLNFTFPALEQAAGRLKALRENIGILTSGAGPSGEKTALEEGVPADLETEFTRALEDDLSLYRGVEILEARLAALVRKHPSGLDSRSAGELEKVLKRLDTVICCLFEKGEQDE